MPPEEPGKPTIHGFFDRDTATISYVAIDPATGEAAIIDPVLDYEPASGRIATRSADQLIACVTGAGAKLRWILETHVHADHLSAAPHIQEKLGGTLAIGAHVATVQRTFAAIFNIDHPGDGAPFDHLFEDDAAFALGAIPARAIHTPGHTPACMSYLIGDALFVGDTLFMPDYGTARCDFPGGDARRLYRSIHKLYALPDATRMFLCHDYLPEEKPGSRRAFAWETTVAAQKSGNIHVAESIGEDEFVKMRENKDSRLSMPRLILPSVQINMMGGRLPAPESNGTRYLKMPLNAF